MITVNELVEKVRRLVNESDKDASLSLVTSGLRSLDDSIKALLPQAVALVQKQKSRAGEQVNVKHLYPITVNVADNGDGAGSMPLPDDYVGPVAVQLEGWKRPVTTVCDEASPEAIRQKSPFLRAGCCNPVCVESTGPEGKRMMLLYPLVSAGSKIEIFAYEATFNVDDGLLKCTAPMADAVAYTCAALLYNMFERYDAANAFMSLANALCNNIKMERK